MATIADLFKNQQNDLYDGEKIRIESRGLVNPPRAAALLASSMNAIGDAIGGQLAGAIGGTANRPSDTIFKGNSFIDKPVSLLGVTEGLLKSSVEEGESYYIKQSPSPIPPLFGKSAPGGSTVGGTIANQAIKAINGLGNKKSVGNYAQQLKADKAVSYGPKFSIGANGKPLKEKITNTSHKEIRTSIASKNYEYFVTDLVPRDKNDNWDKANYKINSKESFEDSKAYTTAMEPHVNANQVIVLFKKYGNKTVVPFVGAVTGISEDIAPEWNGFNYVGSPFKVYRYSGVERSLKFNLKLYYFSEIEKSAMIRKINYLKSLAFPYESVSQITYGESKGTSQYAFSPNLFEVSLGDMYKNVFGYMESLSFSIDDNTTWGNFAQNGSGYEGANASLYPSVIEANISIKVIENHKSESGENGTVTYRYNFDGRGTDTEREFIKEEADPNKPNANYSKPMPPKPGGGVLAYTPAPSELASSKFSPPRLAVDVSNEASYMASFK
jgi:hypothetical protein